MSFTLRLWITYAYETAFLHFLERGESISYNMDKLVRLTKQIFSGDLIGYVMVLGAGTLWGTIGLFVKLLNSVGASSTLTAFMRLFVGCLLMVPILFSTGGVGMFKIDKKGLIQCFLLGLLSQALFNYCYNVSIKAVGVATASILLYAAPVFVCIMSALFFKEKIGGLKIFSLFLNILGCFLMVTGGNMSSLKLSFIGIIFGLSSAFLYSLVTIIGKIASGNVHPFTVVFYSFLFGWIALGIFTAPWQELASVSGLKFWIYSIGYGLIPTVGSYLLYMGGLKKNLEVSRIPVIASIETVVATLIGVIIFRERLNFINVLGIVLLLSSIAMMNMKFKKESEESNIEVQ
jgi:drug/metabolite transporter (DMT)-like permease